MTAQWIVIGLGVSAVAGWFISLEMRLRSVQSKLVVSEQKVSDTATVEAVHNFTDTALALAVAKDIGSGDAESAVTVALLSEPTTNGKD